MTIFEIFVIVLLGLIAVFVAKNDKQEITAYFVAACALVVNVLENWPL